MTGMIFGSDGRNYTKSGDMSFGPDGAWTRSGDVQFGPEGRSVYGSGGMMFTGSGTVTRSGNMFFGPKGTYALSGGILFGPGGRTWTGVSEQDVPMIIADDM